jgi:hypothetical protein
VQLSEKLRRLAPVRTEVSEEYIAFILIREAIISFETSVLTIAKLCNIPGDCIL